MFIAVKQLCSRCGHKRMWSSQPYIKDTPAGNILLSAAILFSGVTPGKICITCKFFPLVTEYSTIIKAIIFSLPYSLFGKLSSKSCSQNVEVKELLCLEVLMDELIALDTLLNTVHMASLIWIPIKSSTLNWSRLYLISAYFYSNS